MYMIYHGDHEDMVFNEPKCFDVKQEAIDYAEKTIKDGLPKGHALTLYDCSQRQVWESESQSNWQEILEAKRT